MNQNLKVIVATITSMVTLLGSTLIWPDTWPIPSPLAALFGPFLAMRLGWGSWSSTNFFLEGLTAFIFVMVLTIPSAFKRNGLTMGMTTLAVILWCLTGILAGRCLTA